MFSSQILQSLLTIWSLQIQGIPAQPTPSWPQTKQYETIQPKELSLKEAREALFHLRIQIKQNVVKTIIDSGSQKNLISKGLVRKLGLETRHHPRPYPIGLIKDIVLRI